MDDDERKAKEEVISFDDEKGLQVIRSRFIYIVFQGYLISKACSGNM